MTETEGFPPEPDIPSGPAVIVGQLTAEASLTVTPAAEPAEPAEEGADG